MLPTTLTQLEQILWTACVGLGIVAGYLIGRVGCW